MPRKRIVLAGLCRTPYGKFGESLKDVPAQKLLATCFKESLARTNVGTVHIDEIIAGNCSHQPDAPNIARVSALMAGFPHHIPAFSVQRNCGSGMQAIISAVRAILAQDGAVYLVGGTESMSNIPAAMIKRGSFGYNEHSDILLKNCMTQALTDPITREIMWQTAENVAIKYGISRDDQDEFAVRSHQKAFVAIRSGKFKSQIAPVKFPIPDRTGKIMEEEVVAEDKGPNAALSKQTLALAPTLYAWMSSKNVIRATQEQITKSTVTPANSCPMTDGAASLVVMDLGQAELIGIEPLAEIISWGAIGTDPSYMGEGPACVAPMVLARAGLEVKDMGVFEINEAFAATTIAVQRKLEIPEEKLNIYGGAIALGHPVGASGAMLVVKAAYLLKDLEKDYALISLCIGGGQGIGMIIKNWK